MIARPNFRKMQAVSTSGGGCVWWLYEREPDPSSSLDGDRREPRA